MKFILKALLFIGGIYILAIGIVLSDVAGLGISPASAPPYALTYVFDIGVGKFFTYFALFYVIIQLFILRSKFPKFQYFQIFFGVVLGFFITLATNMTANLPVGIIYAIIYSLVSVLMIALGVVLIIIVDFVYPPLEGMQKAMAEALDVPIAKVKVPIDTLHLMFALVVSLIYTKSLGVIGIGTFFQAVAVGICVQYLLNKLTPIIKKVI